MKHSTLRIAWRNLGRNRRRSLLVMGAIALGQFTLVFVNGLMAGSFRQMLETVTGPMVGHVQVHQEDWRRERAVDLYVDHFSRIRGEIETVPEVRRVAGRIYAPALAAPGEEGSQPATAEPAMLVGVEAKAESAKGGLLESLDERDLPSGQSVVLGDVMANRVNVKPGGLIAIIGQDADGFPATELFRVAALVHTTVDVVNTRGVVVGLKEAQQFLAMSDEVHEIIVHGNDYQKADELAASIAALPDLAGDEVLTWRQVVPEIVRMIDMKWWIDLLFVGVVFLAAAAGIANTATMSTFERTHEFGMLLAVGARPGRIVSMVLIESVLLGLTGVVIGSILGSAVVLITSQTGIDYAALAGVEAEDISFGGASISYVIYPYFELRHILFGLGAVTVTSLLAAVWPALLAARLQPVEAMRR